jgi:hypothetical protein
VGNHTYGPERSGRLYSNEAYADNAAAAPLALRAVRGSVVRRAKLRNAVDTTLDNINKVLDEEGKGPHRIPTPPADAPRPHEAELEVEDPAATNPKQRLGSVAILVARQEDDEQTPPPDTKAA